jgi:hypothetical protein
VSGVDEAVTTQCACGEYSAQATDSAHAAELTATAVASLRECATESCPLRSRAMRQIRSPFGRLLCRLGVHRWITQHVGFSGTRTEVHCRFCDRERP